MGFTLKWLKGNRSHLPVGDIPDQKEGKGHQFEEDQPKKQQDAQGGSPFGIIAAERIGISVGHIGENDRRYQDARRHIAEEKQSMEIEKDIAKGRPQQYAQQNHAGHYGMFAEVEFFAPEQDKAVQGRKRHKEKGNEFALFVDDGIGLPAGRVKMRSVGGSFGIVVEQVAHVPEEQHQSKSDQDQVKHIVIPFALARDVFERCLSRAHERLPCREQHALVDVESAVHQVVEDEIPEGNAVRIGFLAAARAKFIGQFFVAVEAVGRGHF